MQYDEKGNILFESLIFLFVMMCVIQIMMMIMQVDVQIGEVLERENFHNEEIQDLYFASSK